ncbi:hypothetical protein [Staphylococcus felis]|nr:hypothetical protein [Staphylococcus felis]
MHNRCYEHVFPISRLTGKQRSMSDFLKEPNRLAKVKASFC